MLENFLNHKVFLLFNYFHAFLNSLLDVGRWRQEPCFNSLFWLNNLQHLEWKILNNNSRTLIILHVFGTL